MQAVKPIWYLENIDVTGIFCPKKSANILEQHAHKLFKKGEFYANAGISLLNRNSDFSTKETFYNEDGSVLATNIIILDYHYSANKLVLGYKNGRGKLALGLYVTKSTSYFDETTRFIVPFVGYSFDFGKL